jgi:hypothetical protein
MRHYLWLLGALLTLPAQAANQAPLPSHCRAGEYALLNAKMKKVKRIGKAYPFAFTDTGKIVSLCTDKAEEPYAMVAYRFGRLGKVEFEQVATRGRPFFTQHDSSGNVGSDRVFFAVGDVTYYVSIATNQAHGVGLDIFKGQTRIAEFFSGLEEGVDYEVSWGGYTDARASVLKPARLRHRLAP